MDSQTYLEINNLNKFYDKHHALDDVSLNISVGEIVGLLGPNGAGKSTTMKIVTGNLSSSSGDVLINDINIVQQPTKTKTQLGYLPEVPPLYKELTVYEFLILASKLKKVPKKNIITSVESTIEMCGLMQVKNKLISNLSKGFQQRVGIAQAIVHNPKLVVLDEPTVGLDPNQVVQIRELIKKISKNKAILFSSHILSEVEAICNRVYILNFGKIIYTANIKKLTDNLLNSFQFEFTNKFDESTLVKKFPKSKINIINEFTFSFENIDQSDINKVLMLGIESNWGLAKMIPLKESLEKIFTSLTKNK
ncbi:MAG: ABC transporter ATP-binding protein [Hydrogenophilales bacterium]